MESMTTSAELFWKFSLTTYGKEGVEQACLRLQDNHGVNVNLLLLLCWCTQKRHVLTLRQWQILKAAVAQNEQDLYLHRKQRRAAKQSAPVNQSYYRELKEQELELEKLQQQQLIASFNNLPVLTASANGVNGSLAGFIHLYRLRELPSAIADVTFVIRQAGRG